MENGQGLPSASGSDMLRALGGLSNNLSNETSTGLDSMVDSKTTPSSTEAPSAPASNGVSTLGVASEPPAAPPVESREPNEAPADNPPAVEGAQVETAERKEGTLEEEFEINSPLFGGKKNISSPSEDGKPKAANFDNLDSFSSFLKETHGIENVDQLLGNVEKWKQQEEQFGNLTKEVSNAQNVFSNMHPDLYEAVRRDAMGEDWRTVVSSSIDYRKDVKDYSDQDIVNAFAPGKITNEEWEEFKSEDGDPAIKKYVGAIIENSKDAYLNKKSQVETATQAEIQRAQQSQANFEKSLKDSAASLKSKFSDVDDTYIEKLNKSFTGAGIYDVFYNTDGSLKEDAHIRLAMAIDGTGMIDQYQKIIENRIVTKTNQEILERTADVPNGSRGSNASKSDEIRPEVKNALDNIKGLMGSQTY